MSNKTHRTAQGSAIDIGALMAANEEVIAVGNMKVNARGDELGPGGKIIRTRNQVMEDYYKLGTPVPTVITAAQQEAQANAMSAAKANQVAAVPDAVIVDLPPDVEDPELTDEEIVQQKLADAKKAKAKA